MPESFHRHLGPLLFFAGLFFCNFVSRIVLSPLMPAIEFDLHLSHGTAGSFFLFISVGYFVALAGSGFVSARISHRHTITASALTVGLALMVLAASGNLVTIRLALVLLGLAAGLYLPSGIATITAMVDIRHWGKALAIHELAPNSGFMAAPLIATALMHWTSWRGVLIVIGAVTAALGLAQARWGRGGRFAGQQPDLTALRHLAAEPLYWRMILLFGLAVGSTLGVYTMLPLYLVVERGMDQGWANTLIGVSRVSTLAMALASGWVTDRFGAKRTIIGVFLFTGSATLALSVAKGGWLVAAVLLQPMVAACFFPAGFAVLSNIGSATARNIAVSMTAPVAFLIGGGLLPTVIGFFGDLGRFSLGIALAGALILGGTLVALSLRMTPRT
ncbi:MAG TPA: MFS transporter [Desulfobacteraceae bacterium]|nr:MAG: MFS transporter [Deltaproteobacteria bacterium]HDI59418.1 MFS transporter [Desulfobacteraceae bacterium]